MNPHFTPANWHTANSNAPVGNRTSPQAQQQATRSSAALFVCACMICLLLLTGACLTAHAQTTFGAVVGTVTDPTGAVLSGATVKLTSDATAQVHTITTGDAGTYTFVNIDPGTYTINITEGGFKQLARKNVVVQVGGTSRVDAVMSLGDVNQAVEVTTAPPLIQTDSVSLGTVIEQETIKDTPLSGRNVENLLTLVPGVVAGGSTYGNPSTNIIALGNYQIGGGFGNQSIFYVDAVESNIPENNSNVMIPSQDVVAEFKVSTNNVTAEFGGFAGGVVNVRTKSGTNEFHGTAYDYIRNKVLNANNFFSNRTGVGRPPYVQNQYGFTIGGPVVHDKLFFFAGAEWEPVRSATSSISTVPTTAEVRNGDFSAAGLPAIYDTTTGLQFQSNGRLNVIPANRIDPAAQKLFETEYPAPNVPGAITNNFVANQKTIYNQQQTNARVDYTPGSKDTLFARYAHWNVQSVAQNIYGLQATQPGSTGFINDEAVLGETHTLNPTTVIDARASYLRSYFFTYPTGNGTDLSGVSPGFASFVAQQGQHVPVTFSFPGTPIAGMGVGSQLYWFNDVYTLAGSITKIAGRHTIKAGGDIRSVEWLAAPDNNGGTLTFGAQATASPAVPNSGYSFASALLGTPTTTSTLQVGGARAYLHTYSFYVTDTYQVTKKLTANLGLRWDQPGSYSEVNDSNTVILPNAASPLGTIFNPATGSTQQLQGQLALVDSPSYGSSREESLHYKLFGPRVGLDYRLTEATVLRAGYGINYLPSTLSQDGPNSSSVNSALTTLSNTYNTTNNQFSQVNTTVANPFPTGVIQPPRRNVTALNQLYGQNIQSRIPFQAYSYVQQWNAVVERQLGSSSSVSAAYAGSKGTHLQMTGAATWSAQNINQLADSYDSQGASLLTQVPNPFYGNPAITTPSALTQPTIMRGLLLKPSPQYNYITAAGDRVGGSTYNALQASFRKQFKSGGLITVAYTWSKLLSNTDSITGFLDVANFGNFYVGGTQDNNNLQAEKSLSLNDEPQDLTISYGVDLPFGSGKRFLTGSHLNGLVGGWRVNGITSFLAGQPLAIGANANSATAPNYLMLDFGAGGYLQNQNGTEPLRPNLVPGCNRKVAGSALQRVNAGMWFNTACFAQPGSFQFGNERRVDDVLRRQGVDNWDFSLTKTTNIGEKFGLVFDAEFFNIFNRVQFAPPFESSSSGSNWGTVTAQLNNPRQIQFGLRVTR